MKNTSSANANLDNIISFLSSFKHSTDISTLSPSFLADPSVYTKECQVPDLFLKTKTPFNKDILFCCSKRFSKSYLRKREINYFPKTPIILDSDCDLMKQFSERKENFKMKSECSNEDDIFSNLLQRNWIINLMHYNKQVSYGPMKSEKMYSFLKEVYVPMSKEEKDKKSIMVVDTAYDIHYQPESLLQYLEEEYAKRQEKSTEKKENEEVHTNYSSNNSNSNVSVTN